MKAILQPISHPEIGEITIEETLFAIGRREEPFASLASDAAAQLSRRHARIFQENGKLYIVDLESLNGTRVNNQPVGDAVRLQSGDEISLGGEFSFRVEIENQLDAAETVVWLPPTQLLLSPSDGDSGIEAIVVSQFPFHVTRSDEVFGRYKTQYPDDVSQISRRHAVLSLRGDDIYIEDLGSANGTFVSGTKLDEHARLLVEGDEIRFGTDRFRYRVHLEKANREEATIGTQVADAGTEVIATVQSSLGMDPSRTTFVTSASSFLEIFCHADRDQADADATPESTADADKRKDASESRRKGALGGLLPALIGKASTNRKPIWIGVSLVAILLIAASSIYLLGGERREIKALLDAENYLASMDAANRYLSSHPNDNEVGNWALEALIKATVPVWVAQINQGRFSEAEAQLVTASQTSQAIPDSQDVLDLLAWATRVEAHIVERGGIDAPIVIFSHEAQIKTLVDAWNNNSARQRQLLTQIATLEPSFEPVHIRVLSDLRTLRNEHSLFGKAIAELTAAIKTSLQTNQHQNIRFLVNQFAKKYPRVSGLDVLREDIGHYETLVQHMEQADFAQVVRLGRDTEFLTPLFTDKVSAWLNQSLPPADVIARYEEAATAWRTGEYVQAIDILQQLASQPWGDVAAQRMERQKKIVAAYQDLLNGEKNDIHRQRLLAFRGTLKDPEDAYFLTAIKDEFSLYKDQALDQLARSFADTELEWNAYRSDGGIPAVIRVEATVSKRFKTQATRLSRAYTTINESSRTYELIDVTPPVELQELRKEINNETKRQRRSLEDLQLVIEPGLLRAKLDLLPGIQE